MKLIIFPFSTFSQISPFTQNLRKLFPSTKKYAVEECFVQCVVFAYPFLMFMDFNYNYVPRKSLNESLDS
jgi:hypothetical protein